MNYTKPAITLVDAATSAIQGVPKAGGLSDGAPHFHIDTVSAYEADE